MATDIMEPLEKYKLDMISNFYDFQTGTEVESMYNEYSIIITTATPPHFHSPPMMYQATV